jgi:hypothetical protein
MTLYELPALVDHGLILEGDPRGIPHGVLLCADVRSV